MNIEEFFCSRLRMKILMILVQMRELNVSDIARRLGVNYSTTSTHLRVLENEGIVTHKRFGRIHLFRLNESSSKTRAIENLIDAWEHANENRVTSTQ